MQSPAIESTHVSSRGAAARLRTALERALGTPGSAVDRLSYARTTVRFRVPDEGESVILLLNRLPPALGGTEDPSEIELTLSPVQADRLSHGRLPMAAAVIAGHVASRGPVRRYLEAEPILRALLAQTDARPAGDGNDRLPDCALAGSAGDVDRELLALETRDLRKSFGGHRVLGGVDLEVPEGMISVVLGPSGTGKSVLLQHLTGLLRPDTGEVLVRGRALSGMSRSELLMLRTEIGVMFQDGALFSAMNVYDNVAFPLRQHTDLREDVIREVVMERLDEMGLSGAAERFPAELSGGMRKRAGLARALVLEPSIVLCDEPDSGLDPVRTALLGELLVAQHSQTGGTMVVITHDIALAMRIAEHISILWQGRIVESGLRADILESTNDFVQQFLSGETAGPLSMDA